MKIKKAIFPVGGLGTRFLPATKAMPKEMLPIIDKPLIQFAFEEALSAGIEEFIFITGRGKSAIENHFDHSFELENTLKAKKEISALQEIKKNLLPPGRICYIRQQESKGLGHAVWCARQFVCDEPFAVLLADDFIVSDKPCLSELIDFHEKKPGNIVAVTEVKPEEVSNYGILTTKTKFNGALIADDIIEKPKTSSSNVAVVGRYILQPEIFTHLDKLVSINNSQEIQLTDAIKSMIKSTPLYGVYFSGKRFDCGSKNGMFEATIHQALSRSDIDVTSILKSVGFICA